MIIQKGVKMRLIDADALEKEGWSLHRTIRVDANTSEYQTKPIKSIPTAQSEPCDCVLKQFGECTYTDTGCSDCKVKQKIRVALGKPEPCENAVSRAELLSAFPYDDEPTVTKCSLRMTINHLPSITPKLATNLQPTCNCDDAISRKDAIETLRRNFNETDVPNSYPGIFEAITTWLSDCEVPSVTPPLKWNPQSEHPEDDRNVFVARGRNDFMSVCIGHYDHSLRRWYEDRNWFATPIYDPLYWCETPDLPNCGSDMKGAEDEGMEG